MSQNSAIKVDLICLGMYSSISNEFKSLHISNSKALFGEECINEDGTFSKEWFSFVEPSKREQIQAHRKGQFSGSESTLTYHFNTNKDFKGLIFEEYTRIDETTVLIKSRINQQTSVEKPNTVETLENDQLRLIFDQSPIGIAFFNELGIIQQVNNELARILGITKEQLTGFDMLNNLQNIELLNEVKKALQAKIGFYEGYYISLLSNKSTFVRVEVNPIIGINSKVIGGVCLIADLTEIEKQRNSFESISTNLEALLQSSEDVIYALDQDFNYIFFNKNHLTMVETYLGPQDIKIGSNIFSYLPDTPDTNKLKEILGVVFEGKEFKSIAPMKDSKGELSYYTVTISPIEKDKKIIAASVFMKDITKDFTSAEKIKTNELLLKSITTNLNEAVYRSSRKDGIIYANNAFYSMFGFENNESVTDVEIDSLYIKPSDRVLLMSELSALGRVQNKELIMQTISGKQFWALLNVSQTEIDGELFFDGIITNIDEKKQAEELLRLNEERFRFLYDDNPSMYFTLNNSTKIISVNSYGANQLGYTVEELIGKSIYDLVNEEDKSRLSNLLLKVDNNSSSFGTEQLRLLKKDVQLIWIKNSVRFVTNPGGVKTILMVCENISDQKLAERSYKNLFEFATDAILLFSKENQIVDLNAKAIELFGFGKIAAQLKTVFDLFNESRTSKSQLTQILKLAFKGSAQNHELWCKDEQKRFFPAKVRMQKGSYFGKDALIVFVEDITLTKQLEDERSRLIADLTKKNRDLQHFSYVISHDLRAPVANMLSLTSIFGFTNLDEQTKAKVIDGLSQSAMHVDRTIKDLNEVISVRNDFHSIKEVVIFQDIVQSVQLTLNKQIEEYGATIHLNFDEVTSMFSIRSYLHSIFFNIISNSIKYRSTERSPEIHVSSRLKKGKLELVFTDNGIGLDIQKYRKKLFDLYQRFHDHVEGRGLGLYLVKTQVEALNGVIEVDSEIDKGTKFTITLAYDR